MSVFVGENYACGSAVCKAVTTPWPLSAGAAFFYVAVFSWDVPITEGDMCAHVALLLWVRCVCV